MRRIKLLEVLKEDFKINKCFNQRLFIFVLRGNLTSSNILSKFIFKILNIIVLEFIFNSDIPKGVYIGKRIRIPHPYNIVIKKLCIIGDDVTMFHGITIGSNEKEEEAVYIGNKVYIGCNAIILGVRKVGDGAKIGAGAIILKDVKEKETVVGIYK